MRCSHLLLTFVIKVIDVRRAGNFGQQARRSTGPADEPVPLRRTRFIYSSKAQHTVTQTQKVRSLFIPVTWAYAFRSEMSVIFLFGVFSPPVPAPSGFLPQSTNIRLNGEP